MHVQIAATFTSLIVTLGTTFEMLSLKTGGIVFQRQSMLFNITFLPVFHISITKFQ